MLLHDGSMTRGRVSAHQAIRVISRAPVTFLTKHCQGTDQGLHGRDGPSQGAGWR